VLQADLVDELNITVALVVVGQGRALFAGAQAKNRSEERKARADRRVVSPHEAR
jgi:dihydrofolate reductase